MVGFRPGGSHLRELPSLTALLHVAADEVLGVGLQHFIDLVEQVVDLALELVGVGLGALLDLTLGVFLGQAHGILTVALALRGLRMSLLVTIFPDQSCHKAPSG